MEWQTFTRAAAVAGLIALVFATARAAHADGRSHCVDIAIPKGAFAAHDGTWKTLTNEQRLFLAGVYVLNPRTPSGLPYGDAAVLAEVSADHGNGGVVFFVDGDKACTPMPIGRELIELIMDIGKGTISHEGVSN